MEVLQGTIDFDTEAEDVVMLISSHDGSLYFSSSLESAGEFLLDRFISTASEEFPDLDLK